MNILIKQQSVGRTNRSAPANDPDILVAGNEAPMRGILFMPEMISAILCEWKTQTRRLTGFQVINRQPEIWSLHRIEHTSTAVTAIMKKKDGPLQRIKCPYGVPGDGLWVREEHYRFGHWVKDGKNKNGWQKFAFVPDSAEVKYNDAPPEIFFKSRCKADYSIPAWYKRNSYFMPKAACRIFLRIKNITAERLWQISSADAVAEGIYRWPSLNDWFAELRKQAASKKTLVKEKILFLLQREKEIRKKLLDGPVYRKYITGLEVPMELAATSDPKESFITLFLSVNDQQAMDIKNEKNNPWLWAITFEHIKNN